MGGPVVADVDFDGCVNCYEWGWEHDYILLSSIATVFDGELGDPDGNGVFGDYRVYINGGLEMEADPERDSQSGMNIDDSTMFIGKSDDGTSLSPRGTIWCVPSVIVRVVA